MGSVVAGTPQACFHDALDDGSEARSVSSAMFIGMLSVDPSWQAFATARRAELDTRQRDWNRLTPGGIEAMASPSEADGLQALESALQCVGLAGVVPQRFDGQTLVCLGAHFHDDRHGWSNTIFLNWYLDGPPRDFVLAGVGRWTVQPGHAFVFDPSRAHGLVRVGQERFDDNSWPTRTAPENEGCRHALVWRSEEHSLFLSCELDLDPVLDGLMGIERAAAESFRQRGLLELDASWDVDPMTGTLTRRG